MLEFTAQNIADLIGGKVEGNSEEKVSTLSKIEEGRVGSLCFLSNPAYAQHIYTTLASVVIVNNDFVPENKIAATLIRVENAYYAFAQLLEVYNQIKNNKTRKTMKTKKNKETKEKQETQNKEEPEKQ